MNHHALQVVLRFACHLSQVGPVIRALLFHGLSEASHVLLPGLGPSREAAWRVRYLLVKMRLIMRVDAGWVQPEGFHTGV